MTLLQEIQTKCAPALIAAHDVPAITTAINAGRVRTQARLGGIGLVLETLGPTDGAALLDALELQAASVPALKWAFTLINRGELDFGSVATRAMIDALIPGAAGTALKAAAEVSDPVTEAEVEVALKDANGNWRT